MGRLHETPKTARIPERLSRVWGGLKLSRVRDLAI